RLQGSVDLVGDAAGIHNAKWGEQELTRRSPRADLAADVSLPDDTKLWAVLQNASGGVWGGCVYDAAAISQKLSG
ncbi:MAG: YjhG/YagF family D-xylonate dehydratase, partial [Planctomycetes bacterium]|nr:YjhG/YagF family D-xylonate dehydratase [Planctomycetota bacterium]